MILSGIWFGRIVHVSARCHLGAAGYSTIVSTLLWGYFGNRMWDSPLENDYENAVHLERVWRPPSPLLFHVFYALKWAELRRVAVETPVNKQQPRDLFCKARNTNFPVRRVYERKNPANAFRLPLPTPFPYFQHFMWRAAQRRQRIPRGALEARLQLRHPGIELGRLRLLLVDRDFTGEGTVSTKLPQRYSRHTLQSWRAPSTARIKHNTIAW